MSVLRKQRLAGQIERVAEYFDRHPGGVTRAMLAAVVGIPERSVPRIMTYMRHHATEIGKTAIALKIGGVWLYGWAETLHQHYSEHYKRRKLEARALRVSIETLTQSIIEYPDSTELRRQLNSAKHRLEDIELEMEEVSGQLRLIRPHVENGAG